MNSFQCRGVRHQKGNHFLRFGKKTAGSWRFGCVILVFCAKLVANWKKIPLALDFMGQLLYNFNSIL
jgi:hypothetical protein